MMKLRFRSPMLCIFIAPLLLVKVAQSCCVKDAHPAPSTWRIVGSPSPGLVIPLTISLNAREGHSSELERTLLEVSDPDSSQYGQHVGKADIQSLIQPEPDAVEAVTCWLLNHVELDRLQYGTAQSSIKVSLPLNDVESLLQTRYSIYENDHRHRIVRTEQYSLPQGLHKYVSVVTPTNQFIGSMTPAVFSQPESRRPAVARSVVVPQRQARDTIEAACNFTSVTAACVRKLYGTDSYQVKASKSNAVGFVNFLGEVAVRSDVRQFLEAERTDIEIEGSLFDEVSINGGPINKTIADLDADSTLDAREANLDAENILGITWPTQLTAYSTGGVNPEFIPDNFTATNSDEPFLAWLDYLLDVEDVPQLISISYTDSEQTVSRSYATLVCDRFAALGARGVTFLVSSGDYGVGPTGYCYSNDGLGSRRFIPGFPNGCPYVTNVGATANYPEVAAYLPSSRIPFTSGAGFSNYFGQPDWQTSVVNGYLASTSNTYDGLFNRSGRAYPDIAALGQTYATIFNGSRIRGTGTSASAPTAAGVLALVNDALINAGRSPLGFLNPWLYKYGYRAFTDVTEGSSAGCNTSGFAATSGWDAVTGFGTPFLPKLLNELGLPT